jgi:hypothetical protein
MLLEPRLKLDEAELLLKPPPLPKELLLLELGEWVDRLLEMRSPPPLGLLVFDGRLVVDGLLLVDGRLVFEGRFADERSPPGRLADERSPPGRLLGWFDGRFRSPPGPLRSPPGPRLLLGPPRSLPPNFSDVLRFEYGAGPR